jgi:hypothetical protein
MISPTERARLRWGSQRRWRERQRRAQEALARVKRHEVSLAALQRLAASKASAEARRAWTRPRMIFVTPYAREEVAVDDDWHRGFGPHDASTREETRNDRRHACRSLAQRRRPTPSRSPADAAISLQPKPRLVAQEKSRATGVAVFLAERLHPKSGARVELEDCQAAYAASGLRTLTAEEFVEAPQHFCRACRVKTKIAGDKVYLLNVELAGNAALTNASRLGHMGRKKRE